MSDFEDDDEANDFFFGEEAIEVPAGDDEDSALDSVLDNEKKRVVPKKRIVKNPQPKLNEMTLTGPKGIQALRDEFVSYKPDPKADPYASLSVILKKYEHWAHVMYPKAKFDDVISRCETLGDKRPVKVFMQKTRMGIPVSDMDFQPSTSRKTDEIIETEYNDGIITTRDESDDEDAGYYDPFEKPGKNKENAKPISSAIEVKKTAKKTDEEDMDDLYENPDAVQSMQQRQMEEDMDDVMADFDF